MISHYIIRSYQKAGGTISGTTTVTGDSEVTINHDWASAPTGLDLEQPISLGNMKSCGLICTKDATLVTKDAGGSTVKTITLLANGEQIATTHAECVALLGATAVSLHLTSAAATGNFQLNSLNDSAT